MPVSIQRYNQKGKQHPNDRIVFVKALPGPDHDTAEDFLMRVAAICKPVMEHHSLSVMTLEEHEPNREFVGRNFNAGEVIQLVLKTRSDKRWLPFRTVQMVMMHELAHCKQMNHSRAFWAVRNQYADDLRKLWARSYTGDGLWSQGRPLYSNQYEEEQLPDPATLAESLCGGTYRSRGRKRKRGDKKSGDKKPQLSYAERKKRRIEKKFGVNGQTLGADEEQRVMFEHGKDKGTSRVAKSKRARDLRAQAALSRFKVQKSEEEIQREQQAAQIEDETTSDASDSTEDEGEAALDLDGSRMVDSKGHDLVRICEDEDYEQDPQARNELSELSQIQSREIKPTPPRKNGSDTASRQTQTRPTAAPTRDSKRAAEASDEGEHGEAGLQPKDTAPAEFSRPSLTIHHPAQRLEDKTGPRHTGPTEMREQLDAKPASIALQVCAVCSLENSLDQLTCIACANVLDVARLPRHWKCTSEACAGTAYVNSADAGRCGLCGTLPPES